MSTLSAPVVFQCGACHRVISDSNQLLAAIADLDLLVCDAVVGLRVGEEVDGAPSPLYCTACQHEVGRLYHRAPEPSFEALVHAPSQPRYCLMQKALASYVLGSAAAYGSLDDGNAAEMAGTTVSLSESPAVAELDTGGSLQLGTVGRLDALESSDVSARQQLTQLMRVVLALDQRLRTLEVNR